MTQTHRTTLTDSIKKCLSDPAQATKMIYLAYLALMVLILFLRTTMIDLDALMPYQYMDKLRYLGLVVVFLKLMTDKNWNRTQLICAALISVALLGSWHKVVYFHIFILLLLMLGAKDISFDTICKIYLAVQVPAILITTILAYRGIIENLTYELWRNEHTYITYAFGSIYRTDYCAHLVFLMCCLLWISRNRVHYWESALSFALAWFSWKYCHARTACICLVLLGLGTLCYCILKRFVSQHDTLRKYLVRIAQPFAFLSVFAMPLLASGTILLSRSYDASISWMFRADQLLSGRLSLGHLGFANYSPKLFGQYIEQVGAGAHPEPGKAYFFLDSSYINFLLILGIATFCVVLLVYLRLSWIAYKHKKWIALLVITILAIHSTLEHHLIDPSYGPFLTTAFATLHFDRASSNTKTSTP